MLSRIAGLDEFEKDDFYKRFIIDDFNVKVITSSAVQCAAVSEQLSKLNHGILLLDKILHHQVSTHYEELLSQATEIETLEEILAFVHQKISLLLNSVEKLKSKIVEPYENISNLTRNLIRLHVVCDYIRRIIRILRLSKRLKNYLNKEPIEISKISNCVNELESVIEDTDMSDLVVLQTEKNYLDQAKALLQRESAK